AFWADVDGGLVRILDIGSGTVNAATIQSKRFINNASATFNFGMETVNQKDLASVASGVIRNTTKLKWDRADNVRVCGGIATDMIPYIQEYYTNAQLVQPTLQEGD